MKTLAVRLTNGQDLMREIERIVKKNQIQAGVILSAVGSLSVASIRVPVIDGRVKYIKPKDLEIDSLQGTVSTDGCHLHISVSDVEGRVWGGHLKEGCMVRTTCELVIGVLDGQKFSRQKDPETGYDELMVAGQ